MGSKPGLEQMSDQKARVNVRVVQPTETKFAQNLIDALRLFLEGTKVLTGGNKIIV